MARVSILTFHYANNYGAVLQAYGLSKAIQEMGHDVQVLDYRPLAARLYYDGYWPRHPLRLPRALVSHSKTFLFRRQFNRFRDSYLPLSHTYLSSAELAQSPPLADFVVCGSDQVWNVSSYRGFDSAFFLSFLKAMTPRRISYAATFGNATDLGDNRQYICSLLSRFDHISVRDARSQSMIYDLIGRPAIHVLDPCFLVDYTTITPPPIVRPPYILTYCYLKNDLSTRTVQHLQQAMRIPVISIHASFDGGRMVNPGPLQWLSLMHHASFVCTDSFHGTCFSIKNGKQFVTLPYEGGMSRIEDLLQTADLTSRIVKNIDSLEGAMRSTIEFNDVSMRIEEAQKRSLSFLHNALAEH